MSNKIGEWGIGFDDDYEPVIPNFKPPKIGKISIHKRNSANKKTFLDSDAQKKKNPRNKYKHLAQKSKFENKKVVEVTEKSVDKTETVKKPFSPEKPLTPKKSKNKYIHLAGISKRISIESGHKAAIVVSKTVRTPNKKKNKRSKKKKKNDTENKNISVTENKGNEKVDDRNIKTEVDDRKVKAKSKKNISVSNKTKNDPKKIKTNIIRNKPPGNNSKDRKVNLAENKIQLISSSSHDDVKKPSVSNTTKNEHKNKEKKRKSFDKNQLKRVLEDAKEEEMPPKKIKVSNEDADLSHAGKKKEKLSVVGRMRNDLQASRFRYINEQLYTCTGNEAFDMMRNDKASFRIYHDGFQNQVEKWPKNPLDDMISYVKNRSPNLVIADFGCGDAKLSASVPNKVHSFDLIAVNKNVTACNMAKVPLPNGVVDIAVFCLSLMGTDVVSFLKEANRVLKKGGLLKIAEVASRFESIKKFTKRIEKMGFKLKEQDTSNTMFLNFEFEKTGETNEVPSINLLPCVYKRR